MSRIEIEQFREFVEKFAETCSVTVYNMREGRDPTDEGWDILEEVHKIFRDGKIVLYKTVLDEVEQNVIQPGLFDANVSDKK